MRLQSPDLAQRQRDLRVGRERGMTAGEDEAEPLVGDRAHVVLLVGAQGFEPGEQLRLASERALAADPVDRAVARSRHDPRGRIARRAFPRPALECGRERVLHCVLGKLDVTEDTDEDRVGTPPLLAKDDVDRQLVTTGRISTDPLSTSGTRRASSIAWSRSLQSAMK